MTGTMVNATKSEASKLKETVRANSRKIVPTIPLTKTTGKNTASVVSVDAVIAAATSPAPSAAASSAVSPYVNGDTYFR